MNSSKYYNYIVLLLLSLTSCNKIDLKWDLYKLPEVSTNGVETILDTSAKGSGNISNDGGTAVTQRGICYSLTNNPSIKDKTVKAGSGKGIFTVSLVGLTSKTTYFLRAYATNKVGTSYGSEISFTTIGIASLTTKSVSSIKASTAISGGTITSDGGSAVLTKGVCWGTSGNPTIANSKTIDGSGSGSFNSSITGLTANTTYYVRAYATNSFGTAYGTQVSFSTSVNAALPTLTTIAISGITAISATSGGNITDDGGATVTLRGVCWNTTANPTTANGKTTDGTGTGSFIGSITGLVAGTTYYVRAYATNTAGTAYGNQVTFNTSPGVPTITTTTISAITASTATGGGNITSAGGASVTSRGVCWSTSANPTTANSKTTDGTGTGSFTSNITGLTVNTTYYVRAYAINSVGTAYGIQVSFTTSGLFTIGQSYGGGIIFYVDGTGIHGLIAATTDQSTGLRWYNGIYKTTGATGTVIGTGNSNTNTIVSSQGVGSYAAKLCYDLILGGYSDWYLPSKDELYQMYLNKAVISGFSLTAYWSSSESGTNYAWSLFFDSGADTPNHPKSDAHCVRAIRAF